MEKTKAKISIITVSCNSAATIADTVRSVLDQSVSPYEYIVIDGASADGTCDIVRGFEEEFTKKGIRLTVLSEKDDGIYDAMNKGISLATGDIVGIINSDDRYENCAVETVLEAYEKTPFDLFYADVRMVFPDGRSFVKHSRDRKYATSRDWNHPTTFITRKMYDTYRYRNETIHDDYDLILRMKRDNVKVCVVNKVIADFTMNGVSHKRSLASAGESIRTKYAIYRQNGYSRFYLFECVAVEIGKLIIG